MRRFTVRTSPVHGRGVFAVTRLSAGETILEYKGELVSWKEAQRRYQRSAAEDGHTFFFDLDDGRVIDGAQGGNSARRVNHSCEPNCEAEQRGRRVFFHALRDIEPDEELFIDYRLFVEGRRTPALKKLYRCCCGSLHCRETTLAPARG
ncbi:MULTISPECIES: SET domain-containing protein-lysine N-methyltransferase [unclassified Caballeronia]|uniref:SET domain-containing protein n=1 Tax=unclassified Caballeronia TaxID=2646786 RepID=UPI002861B9DC|nr:MULTISPECIES: SET domain-containing protein-lysine N-methyltransferase [unclassified Caballeronia]MDR5752377.1 SET domain-containing protein-lysine N-methyltransferase [Caballeronia sp. LZ024]MDR5845182.1 SET domain-containing protein-lysine N-methyltransferase [Caballeronia sp. LZ031]